MKLLKEEIFRSLQYCFLLGKKAALASGFYQAITELAAYISIALVITVGTILFLDNQITQGRFVSFFCILSMAHALGAVSHLLGGFIYFFLFFFYLIPF